METRFNNQSRINENQQTAKSRTLTAGAERPLAILRFSLPLILLATLVVSLAACSQKETYPPGSYCLLTEDYLHRLAERDRQIAQTQTETGEQQ